MGAAAYAAWAGAVGTLLLFIFSQSEFAVRSIISLSERGVPTELGVVVSGGKTAAPRGFAAAAGSFSCLLSWFLCVFLVHLSLSIVGTEVLVVNFALSSVHFFV